MRYRIRRTLEVLWPVPRRIVNRKTKEQTIAQYNHLSTESQNSKLVPQRGKVVTVDTRSFESTVVTTWHQIMSKHCACRRYRYNYASGEKLPSQQGPSTLLCAIQSGRVTILSRYQCQKLANQKCLFQQKNLTMFQGGDHADGRPVLGGLMPRMPLSLSS